MFESLSDHIKQDEQADVTMKQRAFKWGLIAVISVALFVGLYLAVKMLEG